jgi:imidazoleglycerol phosphate synthase cyclase subunit
LLDVSATPEGRRAQRDTIREVRAQLAIPLTVGGGVRCVNDVRLLLEAGADKVGVNTAALKQPSLLSEMARQFGSQCTILSVDAAKNEKGHWETVVRSGTERTGVDAVDWAKRGVELGAGEILLTSWDRDGSRQGYDLELIATVSDLVPVPVIASGGAASPEHLLDALKAGADAVLAASIFHDQDLTVGQVKAKLAAGGAEIRQ